MPDEPLRAQRIDIETMTRTGPGTLAGRYLRLYWHPVLRAQDLRPGEALPLEIMGEKFTLYRGASGRPHAVAHHCAHRGAQLSLGYVEGDCIRCLYHGWVYDAQGQCTEQPGEHGPGFAREVKIASYPVAEYLGLLFVYMGEAPVPPLPRFPEFEGDGVLTASTYTRPCNYYQNVENGVDEGHLPFTHRRSHFDVLNHDVPRIEGRETEYGLVQTGTRADGAVRFTHFLMPTMLSFVHPAGDPKLVTDWTLYQSWRVPIDDERHKSFIVELFKVAPENREQFLAGRRAAEERLKSLPSADEVAREILAGTIKLRDVLDRPDIVYIQDHVSQIGQGAMADRKAERLGRSDAAIVVLRRLWERDLSAIAEGRKPHSWRYPESLPRPRGV